MLVKQRVAVLPRTKLREIACFCVQWLVVGEFSREIRILEGEKNFFLQVIVVEGISSLRVIAMLQLMNEYVE